MLSECQGGSFSGPSPEINWLFAVVRRDRCYRSVRPERTDARRGKEKSSGRTAPILFCEPTMKPFHRRRFARCATLWALATICFTLTCFNSLVRAQATKPAKPPPLKVCLVSGSAEYKSHESLSEFQKYLEARYSVVCSRAFGDDKGSEIPGLEALDNADVMVLFTRRITLAPQLLERVKKFCDSGKGIVGIRTASHAFQNWLEIDKEIWGGSYQGHYGEDEVAQITITEKGKSHPVLTGIKPFTTSGKLYKNPSLADDVTLLLEGKNKANTEPVAWARTRKGGRTVYTSLGVPEDFKDENFRRLLANAVLWAGKQTVAEKTSTPKAANP
jgi:type 1 glutamine amidotransferase